MINEKTNIYNDENQTGNPDMNCGGETPDICCNQIPAKKSFLAMYKKIIIIALIAVVAVVIALFVPKIINKFANKESSNSVTVKVDGIRMFNMTIDEFVEKWNKIEDVDLPEISVTKKEDSDGDGMNAYPFALKKGDYQYLMIALTDDKTDNIMYINYTPSFSDENSQVEVDFFVDCYVASIAILTNDRSEMFEDSYDKFKSMSNDESLVVTDEGSIITEYRDGDIWLRGCFIDSLVDFNAFPDYKDDSENPVMANK
ncbi:MAG: hypothetical protein II998_11055 [Clostridia bacterium]|nr:hypothetical protein [Clostridia bacterium]